MNNDYIKVKLNSNNEFRVNNVSLSVLGMSFQNVNVKIDTGCGYTTIPIQRMNMTPAQAIIYKQNDVMQLLNRLNKHIDNGNSVKQALIIEQGNYFKLSYGVETGGRKHKGINFLNYQDIINASEISFRHKASNIDINGFNLMDRDVFINYDRTGNILIGMDLLKDWDIHIETIDNGETIFLGCPKDRISDKYLQELENTFHIASNINAMFMRQKINNTHN